jgi:AcrR family transcriptional regulator
MTELRRGRPRSSVVHDAILESTRVLLIESGYAQMSMERVAGHAGVGKQTVYRRWPSKAPLVAEAVLDAYREVVSPSVLPDTGDLAADLRAWLQANAELFSSPRNAALARALAAAAADDPQDGDALYRELTGPQYDGIVQRLRQGVDAHQIRADADLEAVADALVGATLYRMLAHSAMTKESHQRFDGLVDALLTGLTPTPNVR